MFSTTLKSLRLAVVLAVGATALITPSAEAYGKPAWCPSWITSGVAVQFWGDRIIPGSYIENTAMYSYRNTNSRPVTVNASYDSTFIKSASMTVSIGGEYGFSPIASVKASVDASVTGTVSRSQSFMQPITVPPGKRLMTWWAVDLRQVALRYIHYGIGCRAYRATAWTWVTAPRNGTVKPQHAFVD